MIIFKYNSYLKFLSDRVGQSGARTGLKAKLAQAMDCQQTYLSKVFKGEAHLSLEQAMGATKFFEMNDQETDYFLLLVSYARAGEPSLKKFYLSKMKAYQDRMTSVESQTEIKEHLNREDQQIYYSNWYYMAFHIAVSLKSCGSVEELAEAFDIERPQASEIVDFLLRTGLIQLHRNRLAPGPTHIHLKKGTPDLLKHHTNWRLQALNSVTNSQRDNFHYTVVASLSEKDARELRIRLVEWVESFLKTIESSPEETIFCHNIDFFRVLKAKTKE